MTTEAEALQTSARIQPPGLDERRAARAAALAFLLTLPFVVYATFAVVVPLSVAGNAGATARNILANESMFRIGIFCYLVNSVGQFMLTIALYQTLKSVQQFLALLATVWMLVFALMWIRVALNLFEAIQTLKVDYLRAFQTDQLQAIAKLQMLGSFDQYYVGLLFWSLSSTICSYLWFKSRYVPRVLAVFGLVSSVWAVFCTTAFILDPDFSKTVSLWWFDSPLGIFQLGLSVWLLLRGLASSPAYRTSLAGTRQALG